MDSIVIKEHKTPEGKLILAIADKDLLGKIFTEGKKQIDLKSKFYKGEEVSKDEISLLVKKAYILNAVGKKSIKLLKEFDLVDNNAILRIKNLPYVQIILLN